MPPYSAPPASPEEGVDHGPRRGPGRMDDEAGGLVDDQQVVVLVYHGQDDLRQGQLERLGGAGHRGAARARVDDRVGAQWPAAGRQPATRDELRT